MARATATPIVLPASPKASHLRLISLWRAGAFWSSEGHRALERVPRGRRPVGRPCGGRRAVWRRLAISWACWRSAARERQQSRPPDTRWMVMAIPSSAATCRMRFFLVVGFVPSGSSRRGAVLSSDGIFFEGVRALRINPGHVAHAVGFVEWHIVTCDARALLGHGGLASLGSRSQPWHLSPACAWPASRGNCRDCGRVSEAETLRADQRWTEGETPDRR
jgi:hypothetical protein